MTILHYYQAEMLLKSQQFFFFDTWSYTRVCILFTTDLGGFFFVLLEAVVLIFIIRRSRIPKF